MQDYKWVGSVAMLCPLEFSSIASVKAFELAGGSGEGATNFFTRKVGLKGSSDIKYLFAHTAIRDIVLNTLPLLEKTFPGSLWHITINNEDTEEEYLSRLNMYEWLDSLGLEFLDDVVPEEETQEEKV